jgi:hypothetical protein
MKSPRHGTRLQHPSRSPIEVIVLKILALLEGTIVIEWPDGGDMSSG